MQLRRCAAIALVMSLLAPRAIHAQTEAATLRGLVQDASQAVVPGAAVTLSNVDQNRSWNTSTNERGEYDIEQIPPGPYTLAVECADSRDTCSRA